VIEPRRRGGADGRAVFSVAIALLAIYALVQTMDWPIKTALFPRAVGIPLLLLAVAEAVLTLRHRDERTARGAMDGVVPADVSPDVARRRTVSIWGWMIGFYVAIALVGFPRAVPLFVFAYLRFAAREGAALSLSLAAAAWFGFQLLFIRLLHLPFDDGWLWRLLLR
jgi:hypothetical protein